MLQVLLQDFKNVFTHCYLKRAVWFCNRNKIPIVNNKRALLLKVEFFNKPNLQLLRCLSGLEHIGVSNCTESLPLAGCDTQIDVTSPIQQLRQVADIKVITPLDITKACSTQINEDDANFLLFLCKKILFNTNAAEVLKTVEQIYNACNTKSIDLLNQYINLYIECKRPFNTNLIENDILKYNLNLNEETNFAMMIGHCLEGNVKKATDIARNSFSKLPNSVFGYFSYGLCKARKPEEAWKLFVHNSVDSFSWDSFSWLLCGLSISNSPKLFDLAIKHYSKYLQSGMSITHVLSVFEILSKSEHFKDIKQLLTCLPVTENDICLSSNFLLKNNVKLGPSAYFLECLYDQLEPPLINTESFDLSPLNTLFKYAMRHFHSIDHIWEKVNDLKKFYPSGQWLETFALSMLMNQQPWNVKKFLMKMNESSTKHLTYIHIDDIDSLPKNLKKVILKINSYYSNISLLKELFPKLQFALSQNTFMEMHDLVNIFKCNHKSNAIDSSLALDCIIYFLRQSGLESWSFKQFQIFVTELRKQGFQVDNDAFFYLHLMLDDKFAFLIDEISFQANLTTNLNSNTYRIFSHKNMLISANIAWKQKQYSSSFFKKPHACSLVNGLYDVVLDEQSMQQKRNLINLFDSCHEDLLNLCNCLCPNDHSIPTNNFRFIKNKVNTVPQYILKKGDKRVINIVKNYLIEKCGLQTSSLMFFLSYMNADMMEEAQQLLKTNPNINVWSEKFYQTFSGDLQKNSRVLENTTTISKQDEQLEESDEQKFCVNVLEHLLQRKSFQEADYLIKWLSLQKFKINLPNYKLAKSYFSLHKLPPMQILPAALRPLSKLIDNDKTTVNQLCSQIQLTKHGRRFTWYDYIFFALSEFYMHVPVGEYDSVTREVQKVLPAFNPWLQSRILIDYLKKLTKSSTFSIAFDFAAKHLKECNSETLFTWKSVIHLLGDFALKVNELEAFQKLNKLCSTSLPEIQSIAFSYELFFQLKHKQLSSQDVSNNIMKLKMCMGDLISLISGLNDADALKEVYKVVSSFSSYDSEILTKFLAFCILCDFESDFIWSIFKKQKMSLLQLNKIASICYLSADNCEHLVKLDKFFRGLAVDNFENKKIHSILNHYLFYSFATSLKKSSFNDDTIEYILNKYHIVPSRMNTLFARTVYIDMQTNVKFGNIQNNDLCVYY